MSLTSDQAAKRLPHTENDGKAEAQAVIFSVGYTQFGLPNCGGLRIQK